MPATPKQVARNQLQITTLRDGIDGNGIEYIYYRTTTSSAPIIANNNDWTEVVSGETITHTYTDDDFLPAIKLTAQGDVVGRGTDNPVGVDSTYKYEWIIERTKGPADSEGRRQWLPYTVDEALSLWSKYGERGTDGDGVEYVFIRTANESTVPTITNNNDYTDTSGTHHYTEDDFCPMSSAGRCTDDPQGVSSSLKCEWVAKRTKSSPDSSGVRTWLPYNTNSQMLLWAKYAEDGERVILSPSLLSMVKDSSASWYSKYLTDITVRYGDITVRPDYFENIKVYNDSNELIYECSCSYNASTTSYDITDDYIDSDSPIMFGYHLSRTVYDKYGMPHIGFGNFMFVTRCTDDANPEGIFTIKVSINHTTPIHGRASTGEMVELILEDSATLSYVLSVAPVVPTDISAFNNDENYTDLDTMWRSLSIPSGYTDSHTNDKINTNHLPDLFYPVIPGVDVEIFEDPGITGTVLWGAESTYRVALDVNGVSKTLLKGAALDSVYSRLSSLEGYFSGGVANNAWLLEGFSASHFATNDVVTTSANGLMSSADKSKLDGIAEGATNVTEATVAAWGFTKNTSAGTVTSIAIGAGTTPYTPASSGLVTLPGSFPASDVYAWAKKASLDAADVPNLSYTKITGLGAAAVRGVTASIGPNATGLVSGSLLYDILGDYFDSTNTIKDFVNSSISTATATFRGTNTTATTESAFITWANGLTHDLNDYVFWGTVDSVGNTVYKRYKFNGTSWEFEYDLNNSSFTATQWSAINSGITSSKVGNYDTVYGYFTSGILPVSHGGTGLNTLTSGYALIGNGANAVSLRAITNNTSATAVAASTNLITANTLYYHKGNSNINTVGTITSGTWQGTAIANTYIANPKVTINGSDVALGGSFNTSSITAGTAGTSSATSGATLAVPYLTLNQYGIVTAYGTHTHTINNLANSALQYPWIKIGTTTVNLGETITNLAGIGTIEASGPITISTTKRIYFGDTDHYIELENKGTAQEPDWVFHFSHGVYSDSFVTAGGYGTGGGGGGGASALSQLTDVALGELSNGDVLSYNLSSNKWVNLALGVALGSGSSPYRPVNGVITLPAYNFSNIAGTATASQLPSIENLTNFSTKVYDASASRTANYVLAAPNGSNGAASFRKLVAADIPSLTKSKISDFPTTWALANITDADDLKAIEALTGTSGYLKKTAANTWSLVTAIAKSDLASAVQTSLGKADTALQSHQTLYDLVIKNSAGTVQITYKPATNATYEVTLTKAMVGLSNVENTKLSTWAGSQNITTLGTIATGVWNGTAIAANKLAIDLNWTLIGNSATYDTEDYIHVN